MKDCKLYNNLFELIDKEFDSSKSQFAMTESELTELEDNLATKKLVNAKWEHLKVEDLLGLASFYECIQSLSPKLILSNVEDWDFLAHSFLDRFIPKNELELPDVKKVINNFSDSQKNILKIFLKKLKKSELFCPALIDTAIENISSSSVHLCPKEQIDEWVKTILEEERGAE